MEMFGWALLLSSLDDLDIEDFMRRSGVESLQAEAAGVAAMRIFAEPILDNILIPYLRAKAIGGAKHGAK
jgi:hypothetical protein